MFEDDTKIKKNTLARLVKILHDGRLPADWDMLRLIRSTADCDGELSVHTEGEGLLDATTVVTGRNGQNGLRAVKRHQLVYSLLAAEMEGGMDYK